MSWYGGIEVNIVNLADGTIENPNISHYWNGQTQGVQPGGSLDVGDTVSFFAETGEGHFDSWSISFDYNGTTYCGQGEMCSIEHEDVSSNRPIRIQLLPPATNGWNIVMPVSSPCTNIPYGTMVNGQCD